MIHHAPSACPVRRVYDEVMIECQNQPLQGLGMPPGAVPTFDSVSTRLERARVRLWPAVSNTVHQVNIQGPWSTTWQGRPHLVDYDNNWGVALFASDLAIPALRRSSTLYINATFCTAPHPYDSHNPWDVQEPPHPFGICLHGREDGGAVCLYTEIAEAPGAPVDR